MPNLLVSICVPTFDLHNGRVNKLKASLIAHTVEEMGRDWELCVYDCRGRVLGYTHPMNEAVAMARGDFIVAMNDDIEVSDGWLPALIKPLENPQIWCVTPDATHTDGPQVFHPWLMAWAREAWYDIGGLDERFVHWCSDIDIAHRLIAAGHPPVKVMLPNPVTHKLNATSKDIPELGEICMGDLHRFREKWGVDAEFEKHRMAGLI